MKIAKIILSIITILFTNPNTAKSIVIIDNNIFKIFITTPLQTEIFKYTLPRKCKIEK